MKSLIDSFDTPREKIHELVSTSLRGADDGELFIEYREAESLLFDNGRLKTGSFNQDQGFGLRAVAGEAVGYAHAGDLSLTALKRASDAVSAVKTGYAGQYSAPPPGTTRGLRCGAAPCCLASASNPSSAHPVGSRTCASCSSPWSPVR